jgi:1-acyl-sn-glycerol-3-phosphate acyltransferase
VLKGLDTFLRGCAAALLMPPLLAFVSAGAIVQVLLGARGVRTQWAYTTFSRAFVRMAGVRLLVRGAEQAERHGAYVVVSNHESNLDPFALVCALPQLHLRFVVKRQIMQIPIFGHALRWTGNVTVHRKPGSGDIRRIQDTMSGREPEVSVIFFAEGTRDREGAFRPFKKGAFVTAINSGLPILPVALAGTFHSFPPARPVLRSGGVAVEVGSPIATTGLSVEDRDALLADVQKRVAELRSSARARLRAEGFDPGGKD